MHQKKSGEILVYDLKSVASAFAQRLAACKKGEPVSEMVLPEESLEKFVSEYLSVYRGASFVISKGNVQHIMRELLLTYLSEEQIALLEKNADASKELS